ncbi:leucine-rich repeat domain-containing protein [Novosphingobium sp.]|uniref:leucine-rich repeat domain-containing protein n=1 Tax=Novosphingobium sp. TaxID=1874826 RepID=UPI0038B9DC0C
MDFEEYERRRGLSRGEAWAEALALIAQEMVARTGTLNLAGFPVETLPQQIAELIWLTTLNCRSTQVSDLGPLQGLASLTTLDCRVTQVGDLGPLQGLASLATLYCGSTQVGDLGPLEGLASLTTLHCSDTQVGDLGPLRGLASLTTLHCSSTQVSDLGPLQGLVSLTTLYCSDTQVSDLGPLEGLASLTELDCGSTQVSDLGPLQGLASLERLYCYRCPAPDIPPEVLSHEYLDNCLPRLRAWWANEALGSEPYRERKVFLLGNGTVGKTSVLRQLCEEEFKANETSTHGIQLHDKALPDAAGGTFPARFWDFGGQDIYHGTHALFLKSRAIFLICWNGQSEAARSHTIDGVDYRNRPLSYWLDYVRELAGADAPVILVETQCDSGEPIDTHPVPREERTRFAFLRRCTTSARENLGFDVLRKQIGDAVAHLEQGGVPQITAPGLAVKTALVAERVERGQRTITQARFAELCAAANLQGDPAHLLDFLHHTGDLFHRAGNFADQIVLDQSWALEAIYAVFDRAGTGAAIRANRGRFRLSTLAGGVWQAFSTEDCAQLLQMMVKCGMAFRYLEGDEAGDDGANEDTYVAPDLLPPRDHPSVAKWIARYWDDEAATERCELDFALLPDTPLREIMAEIGRQAGCHAVYWQQGVLFFDQETRGLALIEAQWPDPDHWGGTIRITTQRARAAQLLDTVRALVLKTCDRLGLKPLGLPDETPEKAPDKAKAELRPGPFADIGKPAYYVSYAWSDGSAQGDANERRVDELCAAAEAKGIIIHRDKNDMTRGDSIAQFIANIQRGNRVFTMINAKYLHSPFCMAELTGVWRYRGHDEAQFAEVVRAHTFPDAPIDTADARFAIVEAWEGQIAALERKHAGSRMSWLSVNQFAEYKARKGVLPDLADILECIADRIREPDFDRYLATALEP